MKLDKIVLDTCPAVLLIKRFPSIFDLDRIHPNVIMPVQKDQITVF
jgi:hypothetical protein